MKKISFIFALIAVTGICFLGCSDDSPSKPKPTYLRVFVYDQADSNTVIYSNVILYNAATNQSVARKTTDINGQCTFELSQDNYYLEVSAQGFDPSPAPNVTPVPFFVTAHTTTLQKRYIRENIIMESGYIEGNVSPTVSNILIIAENTADQKRYSSVTGPDGYFVIFNVPFGTYNMEALKAGYKMTGTPSATISGTAAHTSVNIAVTAYTGSTISGSISFIAGAEAQSVDVLLRDTKTLAVIPGLRVMTDASNGYSINNIPDGDFILWTSLENDSCVMDPDKNLGGIDVSFPVNNGLDKDIDVTGAIFITSPTNPPDSIYAKMADSQNPTFTWIKTSSYSSAKEFIIEVRDSNGNKIWGGFNESGVVQHTQILASNVSFQYPVSAPDLVPGDIYQWKIYADNDDALNVQGLLSSSEDLMGLFQVPPPPK